MSKLDVVQAVAISGSPARNSKSRTLLTRAVELLAIEGVDTIVLDLATLPADGLLGRSAVPAIAAAISSIAETDIIVAATPVYRATYSGLLKVFFDLLPPSALVGKVGIPIATGGSASHQLVLDHGLRPLFASLGALVIPSATYATDAQFTTDGPDPLLIERLQRAVNEAVSLARSTTRILSPIT
ncbi:MAG: NAD(P)H-dependent oxidoreductase [Gemmatimonadota bacterium]